MKTLLQIIILILLAFLLCYSCMLSIAKEKEVQCIKNLDIDAYYSELDSCLGE